MSKAQPKQNDPKLFFIKFARALTYLVYAYTITAMVFLSVGFFLLLFGANQNVAFTEFVYKVAAEFLQPFRGIFPGHAVGETGYFSASALFAIIIYMLFALAVNGLISYITAKMIRHENELAEFEQNQQ